MLISVSLCRARKTTCIRLLQVKELQSNYNHIPILLYHSIESNVASGLVETHLSFCCILVIPVIKLKPHPIQSLFIPKGVAVNIVHIPYNISVNDMMVINPTVSTARLGRGEGELDSVEGGVESSLK